MLLLLLYLLLLLHIVDCSIVVRIRGNLIHARRPDVTMVTRVTRVLSPLMMLLISDLWR